MRGTKIRYVSINNLSMQRSYDKCCYYNCKPCLKIHNWYQVIFEEERLNWQFFIDACRSISTYIFEKAYQKFFRLAFLFQSGRKPCSQAPQNFIYLISTSKHHVMVLLQLMAMQWFPYLFLSTHRATYN